MRYLWIVLMIGMVGCTDYIAGKEMTRQEVIQAVKECEAAGMDADVMRDGWEFKIRRVDCIPRNKSK